MTIERDDKRLVCISLEDAIIAPGGLCQHYKDRWWSCDPKRGIIFWKPDRCSTLYPQCSSDEYTARRLCEKLYPWAETKFISSVFTRADPQDYL